MANVSCVIITTLIIISLANLLLLVHIIIQSLKNRDDFNAVSDIEKIRRDDSTMEKLVDDYKTSIIKYKFMAAIISVKNNRIRFICSASIISKNWVIAPAHCSEIIARDPLSQTRISSDSSKWKYGIWHDLDKILIHENYDPYTLHNDISLIRVKRSFKGKNENIIPLPSASFKYSANTTAKILGWMVSDGHLYGINVKLFWYKLCEIQYPQKHIFDNGMFCAGRHKEEKGICSFDDGGILVQKGVMIGMVSFGVGCSFDEKPAVFNKISFFENWIKYMEKKNGLEIRAAFKTN